MLVSRRVITSFPRSSLTDGERKGGIRASAQVNGSVCGEAKTYSLDGQWSNGPL